MFFEIVFECSRFVLKYVYWHGYCIGHLDLACILQGMQVSCQDMPVSDSNCWHNYCIGISIHANIVPVLKGH